MKPTDSHPPADIWLQWLQQLETRVRRAGTRHVVVVVGESERVRDLASRFMRGHHDGEMRWLGAPAPAGLEALPASHLTGLLGDECDVLAVDLYADVPVNVLAATQGVVRGGGLLLLLAPPTARWGGALRPGAGRLLSHGQSLSAFGMRLPRRLARLLPADPAASVLDTATSPPAQPELETLDAVPEGPAPCRNADQQVAVTAILRVACGHARRPLMLTADRGRGKSAALGIAAARLMAEHGSRIIVTGPGRRAVEVVFRHAMRCLPSAREAGDNLDYDGASLRYMTADELLRQVPQVDLVLVDEAAALPVAMLENLLEHCPRIVFSTTVHGYEGSGQGFALRFATILKQRRPQARALQLHQPVRWASGDPVEPLFFRALLMDAAPAPEDRIRDVRIESLRAQVLDRDALAANEAMLREVYGLLIQAHYQTRPSDLYQLLDAPDLSLLVLFYQQHVVAVALMGIEGGFGAELAAEVHAGRRRPRGHLLAQSLEAHAGLAGASELRHARVQRIAVHPELTRRGLGRRLLYEVMRETGRLDCDLVGASFGATPEVLAFWRSCRFHPLWLGTGRDAASGSYAAVFGRALTAAGRALVRRGRRHFSDAFPYLLRDQHRTLPAPVALAMLQGLRPGARARLDCADWREVARFGASQAPPGAVLPALYRTALAVLMDKPQTPLLLTPGQCELLLRRLLQVREGSRSDEVTESAGRKGLERELREIFRLLGESELTAAGHDSGAGKTA